MLKMEKKIDNRINMQELFAVPSNFSRSIWQNQRHKCDCGTRWMDAWIGDVMWEEDWRQIDNLMRFVNSCKCMKKEIK